MGTCGTIDAGLCSIFMTPPVQRYPRPRIPVLLSTATLAKQWAKHYHEMAAVELGWVSLQRMFDTAEVVRDRRNPAQDRHLLFLSPVAAHGAVGEGVSWGEGVGDGADAADMDTPLKPDRWIKAALKIVATPAAPPEVYLVSLHCITRDEVETFRHHGQPIREGTAAPPAATLLEYLHR